MSVAPARLPPPSGPPGCAAAAASRSRCDQSGRRRAPARPASGAPAGEGAQGPPPGHARAPPSAFPWTVQAPLWRPHPEAQPGHAIGNGTHVMTTNQIIHQLLTRGRGRDDRGGGGGGRCAASSGTGRRLGRPRQVHNVGGEERRRVARLAAEKVLLAEHPAPLLGGERLQTEHIRFVKRGH